MSKLDIRYRVLGAINTNVYLLINEETMETIIVDPADNADYLISQCQMRNYKPVAILLTHGHFDHFYGIPDFKKVYDVPVYAYVDELKVLSDPISNRSAKWAKPMTITPDVLVHDNEILHIAGFEINVLHTPGHTMGSCCYYFEEDKALIAGDTLFYESFGRTDLETGSQAAIKQSIMDRLFKLPDDVDVFPGHNDMTTIGHEKQYNPIQWM